MDLFEGMMQKERDQFRRVCNKLMSMCFIVRRNETTKSEIGRASCRERV